MCYFSIEFNIMVKHCSHGTCKSDSRYPEKLIGANFIPFPKPKSDLEKNHGYHVVEDHMPSLMLTKLRSIHMCVLSISFHWMVLRMNTLIPVMPRLVNCTEQGERSNTCLNSQNQMITTIHQTARPVQYYQY